MNQVEWIFHACGCRKPHRIFGPGRIKTKQRAWYQGRRCSDCQDERDRQLYGRLQPTGRQAQ